MKAHAVIGANYGDEGKGHIVDYLCDRNKADMVVRFNGGAQAGHTVCTPEGQRHVFHHFGSGSYLHVPTFLSKFFVVNPLLFAKEPQVSEAPVYVDYQAVVTLPIDMLINQALAKRSGHVSCGVGINETMQRGKLEFPINVLNMMNLELYREVMNDYVPYRLKQLGLNLKIGDHWEDVYFDNARRFLKQTKCTHKPPGENFIFEGAQGLMLDQNSMDFPFVTHSNTGIKNVLNICQEWGIGDVHTTYVTRSYLTRHGDGPLPYEEFVPSWLKDETNIFNEWQGGLRYAPLSVFDFKKRIKKDAKTTFDVAINCLDQFDDTFGIMVGADIPIKYKSYGPTRMEIKE